MKRRTQEACLLAFAVVLGVLLLPLLAHEFYFGTDATLFELGKACEVGGLLRAGQRLLLAPHLANGEPLLAEPQAQLFYPLRWLVRLLTPAWEVGLAQALHLALAAAAAAWLGRTFRLGRAAASAVGIAFALSGPGLDLIRHDGYVVGAVVLPLAWAAGRRILRGAHGRTVPLLLASALAGGLLGGEPQSVAIALGLLGVELTTTPRSRPHALRLGFTAASGLVLGLSGWFPALAEMRLTARGAGVSQGQAGAWAFEPAHALAALLPGALSERLAGDTTLWALLHHGHADPTWDLQPYWGLLLAVAALVGATLPRLRVAAGVTAAALLASLGDGLPPVGWLLRTLPGLSAFRYAEKYFLTATLGAVLLAGVALERASRSATVRRRLQRAGGLALAAGALGIGLVLALHGRLDAATALASGDLPTLSHLLGSAGAQTLASLTVALAAATVAPPWVRGRLPLLLVADLLWAAPLELAVGPRLDDVTSPLLQLAGPPGRLPVICHDGALDLSVRSPGEASEWVTELYVRALAMPDANACDGVIVGESYSVLASRTSLKLTAALSTAPAGAARALGCSHLITAHPPPGWTRTPVRGLDDVYPLEAGGPGTFAVPEPLPEAFAVGHPALAPTEAEALDRVERATTAAEALAVIDDPLDHLHGAPLPAEGAPGPAPQLTWHGRDRATVTTTGSGAAIVGLLTTYQAGWTATQGGQALPVVRVAANQVGAVVSDVTRGPIEFDYRLPGTLPLLLGALLGALGIALSVLRAPKES